MVSPNKAAALLQTAAGFLLVCGNSLSVLAQEKL